MQERGNQVSSGVFLIGLALLFATGWWWPGILFVVGAAGLSQAIVEGKRWQAAQGALWVIGIGAMFLFGFQWWLLLLFAGVSMVVGGVQWNGEREENKRKHEEAAEEVRYRLSDDGEIIPETGYYDDEKPKKGRI
jgi:hypothetical protein